MMQTRLHKHSLSKKEQAVSSVASRASVRDPIDEFQDVYGSRAGSAAFRLQLGSDFSRSGQIQQPIQAKPSFRGLSHKLAPIQAKLTVGPANDRYEQEAARVAAQVVQRIYSPVSERSTKAESVQRQEEEEELQLKPIAPIQRKEMSAGGEVSTDLESEINRARGGGQALAPEIQLKMGEAMGADFSGVRVHRSEQADKLTRAVGARAFTTGHDLFFKRGEYQPRSRVGQELIAHELTHVVQQAKRDRSAILVLQGMRKTDEEDEEDKGYDPLRNSPTPDFHVSGYTLRGGVRAGRGAQSPNPAVAQDSDDSDDDVIDPDYKDYNLMGSNYDEVSRHNRTRDPVDGILVDAQHLAVSNVFSDIDYGQLPAISFPRDQHRRGAGGNSIDAINPAYVMSSGQSEGFEDWHEYLSSIRMYEGDAKALEAEIVENVRVLYHNANYEVTPLIEQSLDVIEDALWHQVDYGPIQLSPDDVSNIMNEINDEIEDLDSGKSTLYFF